MKEKILKTFLFAFVVLFLLTAFVNAEGDAIVSGNIGDYQIVEVYLNENPTLYCNGKKINVSAVLSTSISSDYEDEVLVRYREALIAIGATIDTISYSDSIVATKNDISLRILHYGNTIFTGSDAIELAVPIHRINGYTYIPFLAVLDAFGYEHNVEADGLLHTFEMGEEINYSLYDNGELIIGGNGSIPDYSSSEDAPWYEYGDQIKKLIIKDNVRGIGAFAFSNCGNLVSATIPDSVTSIDSQAFDNCPNLTIYCQRDSYAYRYAIINNLTFRILGEPFGDVTGNGKVTNLDASRILQYVAGWDVEIDLDAADVTGDGKVNILDAAKILQFLAEWDVEL